MAKSNLESGQISQIFKSFGYGIVRFFVGSKIRDVVNKSKVEETKPFKDQVVELRHQDDPDFVEVAFNGNCKRFHYVNIGKDYHVGVIHDKETNQVNIVSKTLYKREANGLMKMIDMKKTGFWPISKSALEYDCGNKEDYKMVLNNYKNAKILVYSDPNLTEGKVGNTKKCAAAMVNGRPHGKTSLSKAPNSLFNTAIWYAFPILNLIFGFRESPSKTKSLRDKLSAAHTAESVESDAKARFYQNLAEKNQNDSNEVNNELQQNKTELIKTSKLLEKKESELAAILLEKQKLQLELDKSKQQSKIENSEEDKSKPKKLEQNSTEIVNQNELPEAQQSQLDNSKEKDQIKVANVTATKVQENNKVQETSLS